MARLNIKFKGSEKLQKTLEQMAERAGEAKSVEVGFMEGATYPDGTPVAMVAAIQNFGAPAAGIPARPYFSTMVKKKSPGWGVALAANLKQVHYRAQPALARMGEGIKGQLQASIRELNSPPLNPETIKRKGFSKPLIDTGHMLNSAEYAVDGERS